MNCSSPLLPGLEANGVIINRDDIDFANCVISGNKISTLVLKSGKVGYAIAQPDKAPFTGTNTALAAGTYYNTWTHQVAFVVLDNTPEVASNVIDGLANGAFVVILENKSKASGTSTGQEFQVYGWHQGLKASEITEDKYSEDTDGGWAVTMEETKSPLAATFFFSTSYEATAAAVASLITPSE